MIQFAASSMNSLSKYDGVAQKANFAYCVETLKCNTNVEVKAVELHNKNKF